MANPNYYSVSILENNSNDSLQKLFIILQKLFLILLAVLNKGYYFVSAGEPCTLDSELLRNEEPFDWYDIESDFQSLSAIIPDVCFCVTVEPAEVNCGRGKSRILFYNGKSVHQEPEIMYPRFSLNDFEYETSDKQPLATKEAKEEIAQILDATDEGHDRVLGYVSSDDVEVVKSMGKTKLLWGYFPYVSSDDKEAKEEIAQILDAIAEGHDRVLGYVSSDDVEVVKRLRFLVGISKETAEGRDKTKNYLAENYRFDDKEAKEEIAQILGAIAEGHDRVLGYVSSDDVEVVKRLRSLVGISKETAEGNHLAENYRLGSSTAKVRSEAVQDA